MTPGTIFISHRAEYGELVRQLKSIIQETSGGKIQVLISEDIPRGDEWRVVLEKHLSNSESLFLIYGAPYEDWSWCFYEAGYFAALTQGNNEKRSIYCLVRPNVAPPEPLSHLQLVTDKDQLVEDLLDIFARNRVNFDAVEVRNGIDSISVKLFGKVSHFVNFPRVYFTAADNGFGAMRAIPADAVLSADESVMTLVFGIGRRSIRWAEIAAAATRNLPGRQKAFAAKWIDETAEIILGAREQTFAAPQTVLIGPGGRRFRFLLYAARSTGDGSYCCEFLVIDEVGGPTLGLPNGLHSLLTSIRMAFRFRYELVQKFPNDFVQLTEEERSSRIDEIPRVIANLEGESLARGNFNSEDLIGSFDEAEGNRIRKIIGYWPFLKSELYCSLGLSSEGKVVNDQGLQGANMERFRTAFDALRLINIEFLSRCVARVSQMIVKSEAQLDKNAVELEEKIKKLAPAATREAA